MPGVPEDYRVDLNFFEFGHNTPAQVAYNPSPPSKTHRAYPKGKAAKAAMEYGMHEFKKGQLHSGKGGPVVTDRKQAVAISLAKARKAGKKK